MALPREFLLRGRGRIQVGEGRGCAGLGSSRGGNGNGGQPVFEMRVGRGAGGACLPVHLKGGRGRLGI